MKFHRFAVFLAVFTIGASSAFNSAWAGSHPMKPFVLAWNKTGTVEATVTDVKNRLQLAGFQIAGSYSPYQTVTIIVVTNDALKQAAAKSDFGGYGAGQRVSVTRHKGKVQVSYTNPSYMAAVYRMKDDLSAIAAQLEKALGKNSEYGPKAGLTADQLSGYHYMFGMEYFDEPSTLADHGSYKSALDAVEKGLAAGISGITKVYRIDIPGKEETVFGVAMDGGKGGGKMQDDAYLMSEIDFKNIRSTPHLPYEILVSGGKAYALYARFRIAISFPDLSMMGANSFMNIMDSPKAIEKALTLAAGGKP
ncbi:MAG: hypothetical protein OEY85_03940 [Rhodospirillales bacterium]|nr:hypothetical protein [Rhodospirillales bacterium]